MNNLDSDLPTPVILTELEKGVIEEIKEHGGENIDRCIQCGKCAGSCPVALAGFLWFNKRFIHALTLGIKEEILDIPSPWACVSCNKCTEICPRDVKPFEVVFALRRVLVEELAMPTLTMEGLRTLYEYGHAVYQTTYPETRKKVGLPEKPPTTLAYPEALEELRALLRETKLGEIGLIPME
ncbi:4Fe-4S dicluster domain-containing protein [Archaeoglobus sulfaticallidus]|uniref:4Fe-4S dicluster domain-containing protein n=1 Tax=Archaeoglobus sulfaticallidus TaxID=1316941 RepID=UPI00373AE4FC